MKKTLIGAVVVTVMWAGYLYSRNIIGTAPSLFSELIAILSPGLIVVCVHIALRLVKRLKRSWSHSN